MTSPVVGPIAEFGGGLEYMQVQSVSNGTEILSDPANTITFSDMAFQISGRMSPVRSGFYIFDLHFNTSSLNNGIQIQQFDPSGKGNARTTIAVPTSGGDISHTRIDWLEPGDYYVITGRGPGNILANSWLSLICLFTSEHFRDISNDARTILRGTLLSSTPEVEPLEE
jgi:hypothetical protein